MSDYDSDDSSSCSDCDDDFERCSGSSCAFRRGNGSNGLPFDPTAIQNIILRLSDQFDMRVVMSDRRANTALMITGGLALAGSVLGKHCGGNMGAVIGGAVGGACGLGITLVSLRDIWEDVKSRLWELFELAYDYLAGLGVRDYQAAASLLAAKGHDASLANMLAEVAASLLKKQITTSIKPQ